MAICLISATLFASLDFCLALLNATKTTEANKPIMAITTNSSTKVKPSLFAPALTRAGRDAGDEAAPGCLFFVFFILTDYNYSIYFFIYV